jgi:CxxC motif-containing protein (DUF1111 family)
MGCSDETASPGPSLDPESLSGGEATVFDATSAAFSLPVPTLSSAELETHLAGDAGFEQTFVTAPAPVFGGLGPLFNNTSCVACHLRDGRGRAPESGEELSSLLLRLSVPGVDAEGGPRPAPGFGGQLQPRAIAGRAPEARVRVSYDELPGRLVDDTPYSLRRPRFELLDPYTSLPADLQVSPRIAPPVFGLGLLEAVPEAAIAALADEADADGDGISGRANYVWDVEAAATRLGRFGWKANTPTLRQQAAAAYNADMGITSGLFSHENSLGQPQADGLEDEPEVADQTLHDTAIYTATLAVPARRNLDAPAVQRGRQIFGEARCARCHVPELRTGPHPVGALSQQTIRPYTDLLLHDMGEGLADGRPDFIADGREWRTPPLWGIGLTATVSGHTTFLHDGRARSLLEAILWHGGEAEESRRQVENLGAPDRDALLAFLMSL